MSKQPMEEPAFCCLLNKITQETDHAETKLEILFKSKGCFGAEQAARILEAIAIQMHKVRAVKIMEPRLCRMSCDEARMVLATVTNQNDKVAILHSLKRVLSDHQTQLGQEYVFSAYPFETDKVRSWGILQTVRSDVDTQLSAGGHQGYAALGGLYTQARPLVPHLYGSLQEQWDKIPGHGNIEIPPAAKPGVIPSVYSGHPSYAYPKDKSYSEIRNYPGPPYTYLTESDYPVPVMPYPAGAPPLGYHGGAPAPTGFC